MSINLLGDPPLACSEKGVLKSRIGTFFVTTRTLVTLPGIHATQRLAYLDHLNRQRRDAQAEELTPEEEMRELESCVDLVMSPGEILIRPDPSEMPLAFAADELLQELVPKHRIRFLNIMDAKVRHAIRARGEYWRIAVMPLSREEMIRMIENARVRIGEGLIYYYNMINGIRYLTCGAFEALDGLDDDALRRQLVEIRHYAAQHNAQFHWEVDFFMADKGMRKAFAAINFEALSGGELRHSYKSLCRFFRDGLGSVDFYRDDPGNDEWCNHMFAALSRSEQEGASEEMLSGLSPEFFLQIRWLAAGRIEEGEIIFDPVYDAWEKQPDDPDLKPLCDENAKGFFVDFIRDFGDVEYINIGRIVQSLAHRPVTGADHAPSRRDVYIAEIKPRLTSRPLVRIIRIQKWGIRERLEGGKNLIQAIMESEEYTEYNLDRRLGCRQLGMNLPVRVTTGRIGERYYGSRQDFQGLTIWATYFQRDYIRGIATDKLSALRFANPEFAHRFAYLLGRAAAPNLVVGRLNLEMSRAIFDDGDEVVRLDDDGMPLEILVSEQTGTFVGYEDPLERFAAAYAEPVNRRVFMVPNPAAFAEAYLTGFQTEFKRIQQEYRKRRGAFDTLFNHCKNKGPGSFNDRWHKVLQRLDQTDRDALTDAVRRCIKLTPA